MMLILAMFLLSGLLVVLVSVEESAKLALVLLLRLMGMLVMLVVLILLVVGVLVRVLVVFAKQRE
jgi:hypothetical protein